MVIEIRDDRQMRSLTGLSQAQFGKLLSEFTQKYHAIRYSEYEKGVKAGTRMRKPGGGQKGKLPTMADKLLFVLYYYKIYPTFDAFATQFKMARSKANENLHQLSPVLYETLVELGMMPAREFQDAEELKAALKGIDQIIIDATERLFRRPQDSDKQKDYYSGKKNDIRLKTP